MTRNLNSGSGMNFETYAGIVALLSWNEKVSCLFC